MPSIATQLAWMMRDARLEFEQVLKNIAEQPHIPIEPDQETPVEAVKPASFSSILYVDPKDVKEEGVLLLQQALQRVPMTTQSRLVASGLSKIHVGMLYGSQTDLDGVLLASHYDPKNKLILVGYDYPIKSAIPWTILHAIGQAAFDLLLSPDQQAQVKQLHTKAFSTLSPFEQQDGAGSDNGMKIYFSQALAMYFINPTSAQQTYGDGMYGLLTLVGGANETTQT